MGKLKEIDLRNNDLTVINALMLPHLKTLNLRNNKYVLEDDVML